MLRVHELPPLPTDQDSYAQFKDAVVAIHQVAAPEEAPGFDNKGMRLANTKGSYYYFAHPDDREEVLSFARELSGDADDIRRTIIVPVGILAAHPFDGSGRTSRVYHALLAGKSPAEIEALNIAGHRTWHGSDEQAKKIINLCPPEILIPHIEGYVYESTGLKKRAVIESYDILDVSVAEYEAARDSLSEEHRKSLGEALDVRPFNKEFYAQVDDPASIEFALSAHNQRLGNEDLAKGIPGLIKTLGHMGKEDFEQFVDDMRRFRRLRALANIACLDTTDLGSRVISTPDHAQPMTIADHYIRLTNNLVKSKY